MKSSKKRVFGKKEEKKNAKNGEKTEAQTIKKKGDEEKQWQKEKWDKARGNGSEVGGRHLWQVGAANFM